MATTGLLAIGRAVLDLDNHRLQDLGGSDIALRPKSLQLLMVLALHAGETLTKAQLLDRVWSNLCVTEDSLFQCVHDIRRALGDEEGLMLRTMARRGYVLDVPSPGLVAASNSRGGVPHRLHHPSIAVLPFRQEAMAGSYFAEGISFDLITGLCRIPWLHVVARKSNSVLEGDEFDVALVERTSGVRYVLQGLIQTVDDRLRIHCHLSDANQQRYVWGKHFEGRLADMFDLQDRITECVVGALEPTIRLAEVERAQTMPTRNLGAYDLYLRALPLHLSSDRRQMAEAQKLLTKAVELDPKYSLAKALSAMTTMIQANQGWTTPAERRAAVELARQALADHGDDPVVLRCAGHSLAYLAHEHETGVALLERALAQHTNSAEVHQSAGWVSNFSGNGAQAMTHFLRAMRLSPRDPELGHILTGQTFAHLLLGQHKEALECSRSAVAAMPNSNSPLRAAIFALCELGRTAEARKIGQRLIQINSDFRVSGFGAVQPFRDRDFAQRYLNALVGAGLPA